MSKITENQWMVAGILRGNPGIGLQQQLKFEFKQDCNCFYLKFVGDRTPESHRDWEDIPFRLQGSELYGVALPAGAPVYWRIRVADQGAVLHASGSYGGDAIHQVETPGEWVATDIPP